MEWLNKLVERKMFRIASRIALFILAAVVAHQSLLPVGAGGKVPTAGVSSYYLHILAYLGLAVLTALSFPSSFSSSKLFLLSAVFLYGLGIEIAQTQIPGRIFSGIDIFMNGVGAFSPLAFANSWFYSFMERFKV
ncbi:MAG: VanZ family protein [Candidatus Nanohaloarchaea archaeon]|nr:VanZ family protein [Candidatus Nanohaloarchaea archaeon]